MRAAVLLTLALLAACSGGDHAARNVVLITLDTTRADAIAGFGGSARATPHLAALGAESVAYVSARSVAPLTLPAHTSMLTGLYPPRHGVHDNGLGRLSNRATTLAERCQAEGIETAAFVSALVLDRAFGLDQGFASYEQPQRTKRAETSHYVELRAGQTMAAVERWLDQRDRERRFLLWVHLFDPHIPYQPPARFREQAGDNNYLAEIAYVDAQIGALIARLERDGVLDESLVIVVADHGESLGEHGEPTHSAFVYDATIRVPMLVRHPGGARGGERETSAASVVDVMPTALAALGLDPEPSIDGVDLFSAPPAADRGVYFESYAGYLNYGWAPLAGWFDARGKVIASATDELYEIARDPREQTNLASERAADVERARTRLREVWSAPRLPADESDGSAEMVAALRSLGYAGGGRVGERLPEPTEPSDLPSPRERAAELERMLVAHAMIEADRGADAIVVLEQLIETNPRHALARDLASVALMRLGRFDRAREHLEARRNLGPERADTWLNLATCRERAGDLSGALDALNRALEIDSLHEHAHGERERLKALIAGR